MKSSLIRSVLVSGVLMSMLTLSPSVNAQRVLSLDGTRTGDENEGGGSRYLTSPAMADATALLNNAGFTIGLTDRFLAANIAGANVLYTGAVSTDFTAAELADIRAFVAGGGGLVIQRDWNGFYQAADPLAVLFGASYDPGPYGLAGSPAPVLQTAASPVWSGPAGTVSQFDQVYSSAILGANTIGVHSTGGDGLATLEYGSGRVVFLTDMDAWDTDSGDTVTPQPGNNNAIVWENIFFYAAGSSSVPDASSSGILLGCALLALGALKRRLGR